MLTAFGISSRCGGDLAREVVSSSLLSLGHPEDAFGRPRQKAVVLLKDRRRRQRTAKLCYPKANRPRAFRPRG